MIKFDFEFDTPHGIFRDALCFLSQSEVPGNEELEALKVSRLNNWIEQITKPSIPTDLIENYVVTEPDIVSDVEVS